MIYLYHDTYKGRTECLDPLAELTSAKTKWEWTDVSQKAFDKAKKMLSKEVLPTYPKLKILLKYTLTCPTRS